MNAVREPDPVAEAQREQLTAQFVARSIDEIEQMRRSVPQLIKGDPATWQEVRFWAQRMGTLSHGLGLGVLAACARELAALTDERFAGAKLDEFFLMTVTTAIESVALELNSLASQKRV
jgi:hypothetical protein